MDKFLGGSSKWKRAWVVVALLLVALLLLYKFVFKKDTVISGSGSYSTHVIADGSSSSNLTSTKSGDQSKHDWQHAANSSLVQQKGAALSAKNKNFYLSNKATAALQQFDNDNSRDAAGPRFLNRLNNLDENNIPIYGRPATQASTFSLNSGMLGWKGPFNLGTEYSDQLGWTVHGEITNNFYHSLNNAFNLAFAYGENEYRLGGTLGHRINDKQLIEVTAERLAQNLNFDFASGAVKKWVGQNAAGVGYQYLLSKSWLQDLNFNGYYAKADSKDLGIKQFIDGNGNLMDNYRRIAGARSYGASGGLDILPSRATKVALSLQYDDVNYQTKYQANEHNSGLGESLDLEQLLTSRFKVKVGESLRKLYNTYDAGLAWLFDTAPGTNLELQLSGRTIRGEVGQPKDNRIDLTMSYKWDGDPRERNKGYSFFAANNNSDLLYWTAKPAVHMDEVLAMADQKSVLASPNTPLYPVVDPPPEGATIMSIGEPYLFDLGALVHFNDEGTVSAGEDDTITFIDVRNLPNYLTYDQEKAVLSCPKIPDHALIIKPFFYIKACNKAGCTEGKPFNFTLGGGKPKISDIGDQNAIVGEQFKLPLTISDSFNEGKTEVAADADQNSKSPQAASPLPDWLKLTPHDDPNEPDTFIGTPSAPSKLTINVHASNSAGEITKSFKLNVTVLDKPVIDPIPASAKHASLNLVYDFLMKPIVHGANTITLENAGELPSYLNYDATNAEVKGLVTNDNQIDAQFKVKACNGANNENCSESDPFSITVGGGVPVIPKVDDQNYIVGQQIKITFDIPDKKNEGKNKVEVNTGKNDEPLPSWLKFTSDDANPGVYLLEGTPTQPLSNPLVITVYASNTAGEASESFKINVAPETISAVLLCPEATSEYIHLDKNPPDAEGYDDAHREYKFAYDNGGASKNSVYTFLGSKLKDSHTYLCAYVNPLLHSNVIQFHAISFDPDHYTMEDMKYASGSTAEDCGSPDKYNKDKPATQDECKIRLTLVPK